MSHNPFLRVLTVLSFCLLGWTEAQQFQVTLPNSLTLIDKTAGSILVTVNRPQSEIVIDEKTTQCLTDAFETPGQAWRVNVSAGGVTFFAPDQMTITPWKRGQDLDLNKFTPPSRNVYVVVIDKFGSTAFPLKEKDDIPLLQLNLNHGNLVVAHLRGVLEAVNNAGASKIMISTIDIDTIRSDFDRRLVHTADLVKKLPDEFKRLEIDGNHPVIINMSFAILPCELQRRYFELSDAAEKMKPPVRLPFKQFLDRIVELNGHQADAEEYIKLIISPTSSQDPLRKWLQQQQLAWNARSLPFVIVAASGNYALPFQTMPAAWPEVLGVAASRVDQPVTKTEWSDAGDVVEVGQWYTFRGATSNPPFQQILSATTVQASGASSVYPVAPKSFSYLGTSFAAPTVTAALAIALGNPASKCYDVTTKKFAFAPFANKNINHAPQHTAFSGSFRQCR